MKNIKQIYDDYSMVYLERLNANKPYIIEAFTEFYGEKHRDYITSIINNLDIHFYLNYEGVPKNIQSVVYSHFLQVKEKLANMRLKGASARSLKMAKIKAIYLNPIDIEDDIYYALAQDIDDDFDKKYGFMYTTDNPKSNYKAMILPLFGVNDLTLFHEINHMIGTHVFGYVDDVFSFVDPFETENTTELINEFTAIKILQIYRKKYGYITNIPALASRELKEKFYLIEDFYNRFERIIKETLASGNVRFIEGKLGEKNFYSFVHFVDRLYSKKKVTKEDLKRLQFLNFMMTQHLAKEQDYDYEAFYQELESLGYKVRRL